ncbi:unnamed protein product [Auanema sp. JU1783]|nr:unnamed protein product [Auanema sp. JU1783]
MIISVEYYGSESKNAMEIPGDHITAADFKERLEAHFNLKLDSKAFMYVEGLPYSFGEMLEQNETLKNTGLHEQSYCLVSSTFEKRCIIQSIGITEDKMANLIRSIKVKHENFKALRNYMIAQRGGSELYQSLRQSTNNYIMHTAAHSYPTLIGHYEEHPDDLGSFLMLFTASFLEQQRAAQQPISEAQKIIHRNKAEAIEENPEMLIETNMLYFRTKINGVEIVAFVDTGAQQSLISPRCVRNCNLEHLIDQGSSRTFYGIGGIQKSYGRIWKADIEVTGHQVPVSLHVVDGAHDMLLGLDIMLRHRAVIDLANRTITFGSAIGKFLTDEESALMRREEAERRLEDMDTDPSV